MKKKLLFIIITVAVLLTGCKSLFTPEGNLLSAAKRAEKQNDYHTAVLSAVEAVRIDNQYKKAIEFLKETYPKANAHYALLIDQTQAAGGSETNDRIAKYYKYLFDINESAKSLPPITDPKTKLALTLTYTDYQAEMNKANEMAAEEHYQKGINLYRMKGRENAKAATEEFEIALGFVSGYKDAEIMAQKAKDNATQIVAFFEFENRAWNIPYAQFGNIMQGAAISNLMSNPDVMKYTKIIDEGMQDRIIQEQIGSLDAMMSDNSRIEIGQLLNSNIIVTGTIDSAYLEGPVTNMSQYTRTANIEAENITTVTDSDKTDPYYNSSSSNQSSSVTSFGTVEVEADIFHYTKSITFEVTVTYRAIDVETGSILKSETVTTSISDSSEWADYRGAEEALTWEDEQLINAYEESVKSAQQLATEAASDAGASIAEGLASFLK
ncbi:MAG: hypothetical protein PQJ61_03085 [Spirochaetales bacterium]|uniref:Curli production assembly/transport component CsgG n=1 Tax=Candidatus Thalassospirochaeta sargassi TaxID=3119039 RepID=A0AAJ1IDE6_9SPIO|nr:hypothetical protein [Spirochaetales bacterium]